MEDKDIINVKNKTFFEREVNIERKLVRKVKALGGLALKIPALYTSGIPDRLCLFPGGRMLFIETKATNRKPRPIQKVMHMTLTKLGFRVEVIDSTVKLGEVLRDYE